MQKNVTVCYWITNTEKKITDDEYKLVEDEIDSIMRNLIVNGGFKVNNFQDKPPIDILI